MCWSFLCPVTVEMMARTLLRYKSARQMFTGIAVQRYWCTPASIVTWGESLLALKNRRCLI
ncbi:MAG: hypothetical protein OXR07_02955 [Nitrospira sp.]|nr:hypothetical protein [Nitrospira sp.]MDD9859444.1 hypothetical protein [Nitrospira sp.]